MQTFWQDLRYGERVLMKEPGFTLAAERIGDEPESKKRRGDGPEGQMRRLFEQASKLPHSQHEKIAAVLEAFVNQHSDREA